MEALTTLNKEKVDGSGSTRIDRPRTGSISWTYLLGFSFAVIAKVGLARVMVYHDSSIIRLLLIEAPPVILMFALVEAIGRRRRTLAYVVTDLIVSSLLLSAVVYSAYFGRVPSLLVLRLAVQLEAVSTSILALLGPIHLLFFAEMPLIALWVWRQRRRQESVEPLPRKAALSIALVAALAFAVPLIRGINDTPVDRAFVGERRGVWVQQVVEIVPNQLLSRLTGSAAVEVSSGRLDPEGTQELIERIQEIKGASELPPVADREFFGVAQGRNVIVVVAESLQGIVIGREIDGEEITPNFNAFAREGLYFPNTYSQIGPGNTSDAEFIVNSGLCALEKEAVSVAFGDREIPSLPRDLRDAGYAALTFHANTAAFWNRTELYPALGFDRYFDEAAFPDHDILGMGASDNVLFDEVASMLEQMVAEETPVYIEALTLTNHVPFELPENLWEMDLPARYEGTAVGRYLQSVNYSDRAFGEFIARLKRTGIYEASLIVVMGDHFGLQRTTMTEEELLLAEEMLDHTYGWPDRLNIPLMLSIPGLEGGVVNERVAGQVDVVPTMANLLGVLMDEKVLFGQDLLNPTGQLAGVRYYHPAGTYIDDTTIYIRSSSEGAGSFDARTRRPIELDSEAVADAVDRVVLLQALSDEYLASLPER